MCELRKPDLSPTLHQGSDVWCRSSSHSYFPCVRSVWDWISTHSADQRDWPLAWCCNFWSQSEALCRFPQNLSDLNCLTGPLIAKERWWKTWWFHWFDILNLYGACAHTCKNDCRCILFDIHPRILPVVRNHGSNISSPTKMNEGSNYQQAGPPSSAPPVCRVASDISHNCRPSC